MAKLLNYRFIKRSDAIPSSLMNRLKDIRATDNIIVAVDDEGQVHGILVSRPVQFVESLYLADDVVSSLAKERTASGMIQFGIGWATGQGCPEVVFLNNRDNLNIRQFLANLGSEEQVGDYVASYLKICTAQESEI